MTKADPQPNPTGWLIEWPHTKGSEPRWWCGPIDDEHPGQHRWSTSANDAVRFCRKVDAERVMRTALGDKPYFSQLIATGHKWIS